jgi:hypothetical protein
MATLEPRLRVHPSFKEFGVFTSGEWRSQSVNQPAPKETVFHKTTAYYINHTMVLRDSAARSSWLDWAASRMISKVYIAPHAGNSALISIPGVEGSLADDAIFCAFIREASDTFSLVFSAACWPVCQHSLPNRSPSGFEQGLPPWPQKRPTNPPTDPQASNQPAN